MQTTDDVLPRRAVPAPPARFSPELVVAANRVYHDVEGAAYRHRHPEIFDEEGSRWQRAALRFLADAALPLRILDIGSGTGFVPSAIAPFLAEVDTIVCSDVSETLLACCRENLLRGTYACDFGFSPLDGTVLPFGTGAFDCVTINSVAHHVPVLETFFSETSRVLRRGGLILLGHEPNRPFFASRKLVRLSRLVEALFRPRVAAVRLSKLVGLDAILRALGFRRHLRRLYVSFRSSRRDHAGVLDAVNNRLVEEGVISDPLTHEQITEIVDFHSPDAGLHVASDRGFDIDEITTRYLPGFRVEHIETYNHLAHATSLNAATRRLDARLRRRYPMHGATLFAVLRK